MLSINHSAHSQSGAVLVITLLVLLAITILGVAALQTTAVELSIARNERELREGFYLAEATATEGVQRLVNLSADPEAVVDLQEHWLHWHHPRLGLGVQGLDFRHADTWTIGDPNVLPNCLRGALDPDAFIAVMEWRVAPGGSLVMTDGSRLYENRVYGLSTKYGAWNLVEIGYYVRY